MLSSYNQLSNEDKLALLRAFFSLKGDSNFQRVMEFLDTCHTNSARSLRTLPLDQVQVEQGRAQNLVDLLDLIEMAKEQNIKPMMNTH